jgi:phage terminase large subunit GpA-like protein
MGIDVQHTRFAIVIVAAGRNGNMYLVTWKEIFGNVLNWEDRVWQNLTDMVLDGVKHVTGKILPIECTSIDCQDGRTAELVYRWVAKMNKELGKDVRATRGCKDLKFSTDDIYQEPTSVFATNDRSAARSLAETMGVPIYPLGTHRCQDEILRRIALNKNKDELGQVISKHDVFYFNEQTYGGFEQQMTCCRKLIDTTASTTKEVYRLIPGRHMDAMAAVKNAVHALYAKRVREFTETKWKAIEDYIYNGE